MKITLEMHCEDSIDVSHLMQVAKQQIKNYISTKRGDQEAMIEYETVGASHKIIIEKE